MFEWYVVGCGAKNWHQKDICSKEIIGLCAQNMLTNFELTSGHDWETK
jgi:hypothetical protein